MANRFVTTSADHIAMTLPPDGDDTAQGFADYDFVFGGSEAKTFDPRQPRNPQGEWSPGSGGAPSLSSSSSTGWSDVGSAAKSLAIGIGLTAAAVAAVALAPELFAVAGGAAAGFAVAEAGATAAEAVVAATQAGRLAQVTQLVEASADQMFQKAALDAGKALLRDAGVVDPKSLEGKGAMSETNLKTLLADVLAHARDALITKLGGKTGDPGIAACRTAIRGAYRRFVADKLAA